MYYIFWGVNWLLIGMALALPSFLREHSAKYGTALRDDPLFGLGVTLAVYGVMTSVSAIWRRREPPIPKSLYAMLAFWSFIPAGSVLMLVTEWPKLSKFQNNDEGNWRYIPLACGFILFVGLLRGWRWARQAVALILAYSLAGMCVWLISEGMAQYGSYSGYGENTVSLIRGAATGSIAFWGYMLGIFFRQMFRSSPSIPSNNMSGVRARRFTGPWWGNAFSFWRCFPLFIGASFSIGYTWAIIASFAYPFNAFVFLGFGLSLLILATAMLGFLGLRRPDVRAYFAKAPPQTARRPWFQFSVMSLLRLTTVVAVVMGLFVTYIKPYRDRNAAVEHLIKSGGFVNDADSVMRSTRFQQIVYGGSKWPLTDKLHGVRVAHELTNADLNALNLLLAPTCEVRLVGDVDLKSLQRLWAMREISYLEVYRVSRIPNGFGSQIDNTNLLQFMCNDAALADEDLSQLGKMPKLYALSLTYTHCTGAGLQSKLALQKLVVLDLSASAATDDGLLNSGSFGVTELLPAASR